jgi:hypothetical protein
MSNHTNDPWETEMSRTFDQRVRDLNEAPLNLDQVKGKAVRIRRNRRIAVAGGVLAAAAVIVPVAVVAGNGLNDNDSGPGFANPTNSQETVSDPEGLGFGYLEGKTLHLADGSTVELPQRYDGAVVLGESVYATRNDDQTGYDQLDVIDASGTRTVATDVVSGPVLNDDGNALAYTQRDGSVTVEGADSGMAFSTDLGESGYITAFTGGPNCVTDDCRIYVNGEFGTEPMVYDGKGGAEVAVPDVLNVNGVEGGIVTVQNQSTDTGSCGGVYDLTSADYLWETCDYYLFEPSPDARYVEATHPYLDGFGNAWAAILESRTGEEIIRFDPPEGTIVGTAWQDAEHLLARVYDSEGWSIYRIGVDKDIEQVLGPNPKGGDLDPAYTLLGGH